ncbi:MAG: hypothetical protein LBU45_05545, partial [Azoarcus sp.]|nr:hypothetical protein [Azoarcus sp.]
PALTTLRPARAATCVQLVIPSTNSPPWPLMPESVFRPYPFVLVALFFLNQQTPLPFAVSLGAAVVNLKNENWHRHLCPWLLLIPLITITASNFLMLLVAEHTMEPLVRLSALVATPG